MNRFLYVIILLLCAQQYILAQNATLAPNGTNEQTSSEQAVRGNFIKVNLAGLPLRNYHIQFERTLSKRFSFGLGIRHMPDGALPSLSTIEQLLGSDDPDFLSAIRSLNIRNIAVTPELRWYPGKKGYGRGFYLAAYYRYLQMDISSSKKFELEIDNSKRNMSLNANIEAYNVGLMLGAQWMLNKWLFIDWWIIGAQAGLQRGQLDATPDIDFTDGQIAEINNDISVNFNALGQTTQIDKKGVNIKTDSYLPVTGIRAGLCLGIRF